ncbi:MAG: GNAT family N-acetyltransferase [Tumebacillaceae bacterium]
MSSKKRPSKKSSQPRRKRAKPAGLTYRPRQAGDDVFLKHITLVAMKELYEQATGMPLTEEAVEVLIAVSDTTVIIEREGRAIGYYSYLHPSPGRLYFCSLIFTPNAQGKGYGLEVCRHMEADARRDGVHTIEGHVQVTNQRAIRYWTNQGYRIVGPPIQGSYPIEKKI